MHLVVNALSATNRSGRTVVAGHVAQIVAQAPRVRLSVLHHAGNGDLRERVDDPRVRWLRCSGLTRRWIGRSLWQFVRLPGLLRRERADVVLEVSGAALPRGDLPQIVYLQNPWALVALPRSLGERVKAFLQRRAYASTVRRARALVANSGFMRDAYRRLALRSERESVIAGVGLSEERFVGARGATSEPGARLRQVLCVAVQARHKHPGDLVEAVRRVRARGRHDLRLVFAGPWTDAGLRRDVEAQIVAAGIEPFVDVLGAVSDEALDELYATSRLFAMMSRCESFAIPIAEAQVCGTPVVGTDCCAIPEILGDGGIVVPPGDFDAAADAIERLAYDDDLWRKTSARARVNAERFHWPTVSRPLVQLLARIEAELPARAAS